MGWLSSLFSFDTSQRSRNGQVFSSTHEAFSLPTSSPVFTSHPDAFNPEALNTPEPESARSPSSYTYPPQGLSAYGYIPSSAGYNSRPASSLLPTHMDALHTPSSPNAMYPPLSKTWTRLRAWLNREYPELGDTLNYGILPQDLAQIEVQFGFALPAVVRESYLCVDGQEAESAAGCSEGLFFGLTLLPLEKVFEEWGFWREVDDDPATGLNASLREQMQSLPPGWIRKEYSQRGWIPLIADKVGNYVGVDLNPGEGGSVGQVIVFGRDFDTKVVLWTGDGPTGWAKWMASFVEELESGEGFEIGSNDASEGSEDDLGYESYFYDGNGRGQGDGGGDTGSGGGLRYTGEYRGWNVLEAWADRSLRKWHDAGVISDASLLSIEEAVKIKSEEQLDLDIVELSQQGPGVEVPIPVLNHPSEHIPSPIVVGGNHQPRQSTSKQHHKDVPTISVTRPPAPRPVELPMPHDIASFSSPPESGHSSLDDLESGGASGMREVAEEIGLVTATRRTGKSKSPVRRETSEASGSAIPMSPIATISPTTPRASSMNSSMNITPDPLIEIGQEDLLDDSAPVMGQEPIEPSSSLSKSESPSSASTQPTSTTPNGIAEEESEPDPSTMGIRLVGGGGHHGVTSSPVALPAEEKSAPVEVVKDSEPISVTDESASDSGNKKADKVHNKSKGSLVNLKRLSQLGGLRKKGSVSSIKDVISPTVK
ncbi:hypothetical protein B0H34DRAFT_763956 [Crassisporium funariophilum]|nr:hypothetical protein B0H34DRAFT_763956 [Crassisporium funariophilum]